MNRQLLKVISPLLTASRSKGYKQPGGIRYPGGIVYYPRSEDHQDPAYTPTKLFRVERVKSPKYQPYYLKNILQEFKILQDKNPVAIVKNIPELNAKLWKVKHLIKVTPIVFPYGEPSEDDIKYTVLKENGECLVVKKLEPASTAVKALEEFDSDARKMDSVTLKRESRHRWNNAFSGGF